MYAYPKNCFFFLKENDISNITLFYEVVFFCVAIMLQAEKTTLQMKAIHEYALGVRVFKVISVLAIKEVLNAVWYKTFSQYFKESLGKTSLFPSKEMRPVEIRVFFYAKGIMSFLTHSIQTGSFLYSGTLPNERPCN